MSKKPRPPASIGAKLPTLGEQFGRLENRIQKIGCQPLPAPKNPRRKYAACRTDIRETDISQLIDSQAQNPSIRAL
jgi:hypothetical protein